MNCEPMDRVTVVREKETDVTNQRGGPGRGIDMGVTDVPLYGQFKGKLL